MPNRRPGSRQNLGWRRTLGAELDALDQDIGRFERTDGDRADLPVARQLDARAVHLGNQDLAQQRQNVTAR